VAMAAMALIIAALDVAGAGLWGTLVPLWFFIAGCGFNIPCVQVLALNAHGHEAGTAASLLGASELRCCRSALSDHGTVRREQRSADGHRHGRHRRDLDRIALVHVRPRRVPQLAH